MRMPRFFFHIRSNGSSRSRDYLGLSFPDVETAADEALRQAQGLKRVFKARGEDPRDHAIEIESEEGDIVLILSFADVFDDTPGVIVPQSQQRRDQGEA